MKKCNTCRWSEGCDCLFPYPLKHKFRDEICKWLGESGDLDNTCTPIDPKRDCPAWLGKVK